MPRISRESLNSKYIHVITQGIEKEYIFEKELYKIEYLNLLNKTIKDFENTKILAYCIMDNHVHILIYTDDIKKLSKMMSKVNTSYGIFYNKINNRVGYVFRNRYYTQAIFDRKHLLNTFSYIHRNPVKAGITNKESEYKYSSYNYYATNNVSKEKIELIFNTQNYLEQFKFIHKNFSEENILEIKEEQEDVETILKNIIEKFCDKNNCTIEYIRRENYLLRILVNEIKEKCDVTNKMISQYIGIGKNRINSINKKRD